METPSQLEALALADVRCYSLVAKVHVPNIRTNDASRSVLRGHMISFIHDGPKVLGQHFNEARIENFLSNIQLVFIGPEDRVTELERKSLAIKSMQLRPHVLYNHLALRFAVG